MTKNVILAFTGGLQSSVCLHWLSKKRGANVTALIVELGPDSRSYELGEQAVKLGAAGAHVEDCREKFIREYAFRALRASAVYERGYLLSGALARPLIAEVLTRRARENGFHSVALGTCKTSNDAARFRSNVRTLAPDLNIITPDQLPPLQTRHAAMQYAEKYSIVPFEGSSAALSYDINLWGGAVAVEPEHGTWEPLSGDYYQLTADPRNAPEQPEELKISFEKGTPASIDDIPLPPEDLVEKLNMRAGKHGVGRTELVEDRLLGLKSREVYEAPGACVLMEAHSALEELCLDQQTLQIKGDIGRLYASLVYRGEWFHPLREACDSFVNVTQRNVNGMVRVSLYRGIASVTGRQSAESLFGKSDPDEPETATEYPPQITASSE